MKDMIDLRSDTVTLPTRQMLDRILNSDFGDDVYGEDPTVNQLEKYSAEITGKESSILVPSGTMGNLISVMVHCQRGDEVILGDKSHIFQFEAGGISALGSVQPHILPNESDGTINLEKIENAVRDDNIHKPRTRLICIENTHNLCSGSPLGVGYMNEIFSFAKSAGLKLHLDGARIFNAAAALDIDVCELTGYCDSLSLCLSKGLGAPAGSLICSDKDFISSARRYRKMLGGGMRQAGILAAAGLEALETMCGNLKKDHENASYFADGLDNIPGIDIVPGAVKTNILYFRIPDSVLPDAFSDYLESKKIKIMFRGNREFRAVTHRDVTHDDIEKCLKVIEEFLNNDCRENNRNEK